MEELQGLLSIQQQDLEVHDWLGNGASGVVFQGVWRNNGKEQIVAIKKMKVSGKEIAEDICKELKTMQSLQYEHICKVFGGCVVNNGEQVWLVMEFVDGGDLHNFLHKLSSPLSRELQLSFCIQATKALAFLHSTSPSPILHRDIKSLNFLVQNKSKLLLTDFGLSKAKSLTTSSTFTVGTVRWAAPEVITTNKPQWSEKADIYSLGMVYYEILTRTLPYQDESNLNNIIKKIRTGTLPKILADCPKELATLIYSCLNSKPNKRPSAFELITALESLIKVHPDNIIPLSKEAILEDTLRKSAESARICETISEINSDHLRDIFLLVANVRPLELPLVVANFHTIFWWLVNHDDDLTLTRTLLHVATGFKTPPQLFHHLVSLFKAQIDPAIFDPKRVLIVLRMWVESLFKRDFLGHHLVARLFAFIEEIYKLGFQNEANMLKLILLRVNKHKLSNLMGWDKRNVPQIPASARPSPRQRFHSGNSTNGRLSLTLSPLSQPSVSQETRLLDWNVTSVAEQFTLIEFSLFKAVELHEISNVAWKSEIPRKTSPNVINLFNRYDLVSQWAATEVVMAQSPKHRVAIIEKLIALAFKCFELRNYNSTIEIVSGLNRGSVQRLILTWEAISQSSRSTFNTLVEVTETRNNFKNYREHLRKSTFPCLPYFSLFLRDLTSIEETCPSVEGELINFDKIYKISKIFKDFLLFQQTQYGLEEDDNLQPHLRRLLAMPEEMLLLHSKTVEPTPSSSSPPFSRPPPSSSSPKMPRKASAGSASTPSFPSFGNSSSSSPLLPFK